MMRCFYFCLILVFFVACDDGDVLTVDLDFSQDLERCDNFEDFHLIYDTRDDPSEALILIFPKIAENNAFFADSTTVNTDEIREIGGPNSDIRFIYRTYNRNLSSAELCEIVPPGTLSIIEDYEANSGTVEISVTFEDDDNDGVASVFEDINGNGNFDDDDTDDDGIPNYLDEDDDGDNVRTRDEIDNSDGDNDPTNSPLNTDLNLPNGDEIPDYLDKDDDGDGIDTRLEDENGANGLRDDQADNEAGVSVPHYLNPAEAIAYDFEPYNFIRNQYTRTTITRFVVKDIDLDILRSEVVDFGTLITEIIFEEEEPEE